MSESGFGMKPYVLWEERRYLSWHKEESIVGGGLRKGQGDVIPDRKKLSCRQNASKR